VRKIDPDNFRRATRETSRDINRRILLNLVRERQPVSRADLARAMGVARGTITALVNELIEDGLVREGETGSAPRGRKPTLLHISAHDRLAVGVDVRRSETNILLTDFHGVALARDRFRTPASPTALVEELAIRIRKMTRTHAATGSCRGIGLVVPGVVSCAGRLLNAPTLGWTDVDLGSPLQTALDLPVHVERDAVACALARIWLGDRTGADSTSFVYVTVSDGLGTGLVINGQVVRGSQYAAGEFGHVPLSPVGPRCSCGACGCWEAYASNAATVARYLEALGPAAHAGVETAELTVAEVVDRACAGETTARETLLETGRYLGMGLAAVINVLDPGLIIVAGDIARAWDLIGPIVREVVVERTLTRAAAATPIQPEVADGEQRLRGATAVVVAPLFAAPTIA
jgi:predicted NBD/HSP70 family sugar kinase